MDDAPVSLLLCDRYHEGKYMVYNLCSERAYSADEVRAGPHGVHGMHGVHGRRLILDRPVIPGDIADRTSVCTCAVQRGAPVSRAVKLPFFWFCSTLRPPPPPAAPIPSTV